MRTLYGFLLCFWAILVLWLGACGGSDGGEEKVTSIEVDTVQICNAGALWEDPEKACVGDLTCIVTSESCSCPPEDSVVEDPICESVQSLCSCVDGSFQCDPAPQPPFDAATQCTTDGGGSGLKAEKDCALVDAWDLPGAQCTGAFSCTVMSEDCSCASPAIPDEREMGSCQTEESICSCTDGSMTCDLDPHPPFDYATQCGGPTTQDCPDGICEVGQCVEGKCLTWVSIGEPCVISESEGEPIESSDCGGAPFTCDDSGYCAAPCSTTADCAIYEGVGGLAGYLAEEGPEKNGILPGTYVCDTQQGTCVLKPLIVGGCSEHFYLKLEGHVKSALSDTGMGLCSMPFGVLIAADNAMPAAYISLAAQIVAEMMDQDMDGVADDPALAKAVSRHHIAWLAMPTDQTKWESEQLPKLQEALGYDIIIPSWWMDVQGDTPTEHARRVMVEEITHFLTQFGYSEVYPAQFGVNDWTSVIAQETQKAQCVFWQHPENSCPGSPGDSFGDCSDPSCDVVEFYQQVLTTRVGMTPAWLGIGFPEDATTLEGHLSDDIKAVMDDPQYHQLKAPLTFSYPLAQ